jgi:hypothetical protein
MDAGATFRNARYTGSEPWFGVESFKLNIFGRRLVSLVFGPTNNSLRPLAMLISISPGPVKQSRRWFRRHRPKKTKVPCT